MPAQSLGAPEPPSGVHVAPGWRRWLPGAAAAGAAAVVGLATAMASGAFSARGDSRPPAPPPAESAEVTALSKLHEWLRAKGADVPRVQIQRSQAGPGAGLGVFATATVHSPRPGASWWSWLWPGRAGGGSQREPVALASFPLAAAITVRTACEDPVLGEQFSWMLDKQLLDERTAVMVYLLIERLRGDRSRFAPWIESLPRSFDVPVTFSDSELAELRGTTLHRATATVSKRMRETWSRLEVPLAAVARNLGLRPPAWEDWVWAYCVFWSRGQSLPVPESGAASSALARHSAGRGDQIPIQILEGLVPGLDFCNHRHSPAPQCWWEVVAPERPSPAAKDGGGMGSGLGMAEWDDVMCARVELLQAYGLRPQFFLPHPDRVAAAAGPSGAAPTKAAKGRAAAGKEDAAPGSAAAEGADADSAPLVLPGEVLDTLEVFVLNFQELAVRSKALQAKMEERRAARTAGEPLAAMAQHSPVLELSALRARYERMSLAELRHWQQALGLRMASLTTFLRLLEVKVVELEGEEGTGPLEADEQLLQQLDQAAEPASSTSGAALADNVTSAQQAKQQQQQRRLHSALVYRMGQKELARAWLVRAKGELRSILALMRDMQSRQESLERSQL
ncbi:hypothetical protein TSOC_002092 [Tetrabaena socialis]|uniref:SET domain-containing protein n=1 Tax=Tetrabaena socialis TaxID=47790 RepID=A0A2J8AF10_9CHLO|nr:hypothetical protein TSOC_002092 [Tetrabaena socialis]|eukprot:PNH11104.1 hypothetical protein TSOC_002092 [Tetrabaena socialis]